MSDDQPSASGFLRKAIALITVIVIAVLVLGVFMMRLLPRLVKLFLLAVVIGIVVYLIKVGRSDPTAEPKDD